MLPVRQSEVKSPASDTFDFHVAFLAFLSAKKIKAAIVCLYRLNA
jgi:hypothetical protein